MNKGYAFGFLIVLLVLILGLYVAYTGFVASREVIRARPTSPAKTEVAQLESGPTSPGEAVTATQVLTLTASPEVTGTQVLVTAPLTTPQTPATELPAALPTEVATAPDGEPSPTPIGELQPPTPVPNGQPPTPAAQPAYQFRLAGPPAPDPGYPICCYIYGTVRDAAGNGLEGIQVQALNQWTVLPPAMTKGGTDLGKYDIPISTEVANWEVVLVDGAGNPISTKVQIQFDATAVKGVRVDWQRTN